MKKTITIEDVLPRHIEDAREELRVNIAGLSGEELDDKAYELIPELADSYTPVYYYEQIDCLYLHRELLDTIEEIEEEEIPGGFLDKLQAAIYTLIGEALYEELDKIKSELED